ncbi:3-oxoacyl-[acyl-carrier protein] reductase [Rhodopseudomonas thermotolerans]|uniref:3-oxoacyl-[acyl-carrier protein] reductase n=2 Tax=Rhodopseudomonas TaxID=1073 RepID=A0A336JUD9_9BRAD|nr:MULTISPECIES: 3-oxoacyl-ACP reductase family protein [Rhodopseudomonas]RED33188.1 3-oxoacyl-[acyl-carrier protein] reductase [Rhodopseudomonas pentothenatexigens]REF93937.1 3-oxoacyl-[acyl-carrier protein] reductase [Rhodopseudomonas thermotolerans]SSW91264.1 3-oxoacyl-[acyl-carrier protein] reductase [Rhodopseudomonas pentothenatexigens]
MIDAAIDRQSAAAIVFGGSRGIGAAIAQQLADDGFAVALTYLGNADKAEAVSNSIRTGGGRAIAVRADSRDPAEVRHAVEAASRELGPLDVVVVNAGALRIAPLRTFPREDFDLLVDINIRGVFLAIQASMQVLRDGGRIITIGSNGAVRAGSPEGGVYAMTKAAVASLVQSLALELAPRGITVNNVQPGPIETDMTAGMIAGLVNRIPLRRIGKPCEIAALVSYLASSDAGYMTGANLTIDGGMVL